MLSVECGCKPAPTFMLSPTVIGVVLHLLGLKSNFGQVEVQRGEAELDFNLTEIGLQPKSVKSNTYYRWT